MSALLSLTDIAIERGGRRLMDGVNCAIEAGRITVVLGPNGAGKSSLLLAMAGLIPAAGRLMLDGAPLHALDRDTRSRRIAWQGELPPVEFGLTVRQRLQLAADRSDAPLEAAAADMDLAALLARPLGELSSGERQRVELAALMLRDAPLWLLDEPTAHLDLKHQIHCIRLLKREAQSGRAIVTVLHDIQQAMAVADQLMLIDGNGRVICDSAAALLNSRTMSRLFQAPLLQQGSLLIPDYREETS